MEKTVLGLVERRQVIRCHKISAFCYIIQKWILKSHDYIIFTSLTFGYPSFTPGYAFIS